MVSKNSRCIIIGSGQFCELIINIIEETKDIECLGYVTKDGNNNSEIKKEVNLKNFDDYDMHLLHTPHSEFVKLNLSQYNVPIFDATGSDFIDDAERI